MITMEMRTKMNKPRVLIPLDSWRTMSAYVDLVDTEITGFFDVDFDEEQWAFVVGKVYLVKQEAGGADVEMDEDALADFTFQMIKEGKDQLPRGWWHSHVNMGVFFSGTDDTTINTDFKNDSFTVSIVVNKKREHKASAVIWQEPEDSLINKINEAKGPLRIDDLEVTVQVEHLKIPAALEKEVKAKVTTRTVATWNRDHSQGSMSFGKKGKKIQSFLPSKKDLLKTKINGKTPKTLPKDKLEALVRVDELGLVRTYKKELRSFAFIDPNKGDIWIDSWGVVTIDDYKDVRGYDDSVRDEMTSPLVSNPYDEMEDDYDEKYKDFMSAKNRCVNCGYHREYHNSNHCAAEIYPDDLPRNPSLDELDDDGY